VLAIPNAGKIGRQSSAIDRLLALELLKNAELGDVDLVCFQRLPLQSELFREVQQLSGLLARLRVHQIVRYSTLSLTAPAGKRPRVFSGKIAHEVRRKTRILQRAFPGKVRFKCFCRPIELDAGIRDAMMVAATSWQNYLGCFDNLKLFAKQEWLRIYVLYVEDIPRAYLIGQHYNHTFYCQHAGYHPDFARYSVGSLLTAWALESMAAAGVEQVDLGEGGQEHNRRLGCELRCEGTVHVYSRTWRGFSLNILFAMTQILRDCGRRVLLRLRLQWVAKRWRKLVVSRWRCQNPDLELYNQLSQANGAARQST
jgi:CelD/BcsL family acetyltransferase involved in cellulose biosynthesis